MSKSSTQKKTALVACGGTALNLGPLLNYAGVDKFFIDTSEANFSDQIPEENLYKIRHIKGGGQDRRLVYEACTKGIAAPTAGGEDQPPVIQDVIERFGLLEYDFVILLFSLSGASGSTVGPLLMSQLSREEIATTAVVVGDTASATFTKNTISTLKTLELNAIRNKRPLVISYHENQTGVPESVVDDEVVFVLHALAHLTSQNNHGLDTQDVFNAINYNKLCPIEPQLSALSIFSSRQDAGKLLDPITVLSLYDDREQAAAFGNPYYTKTGYPRNPNPELPPQLHYIVSTALIEDHFKLLDERQTQLNRTFGNYKARKGLLSVDDNAESDFIG